MAIAALNTKQIILHSEFKRKRKTNEMKWNKTTMKWFSQIASVGENNTKIYKHFDCHTYAIVLWWERGSFALLSNRKWHYHDSAITRVK